MELLINNLKYLVLRNDSNIYKNTCILRVLSDDPTQIDHAFLSSDTFKIKHDGEDNYTTYNNDYTLVYVELRHNQDLGYVFDEGTGEYTHKYGDIVTVYLADDI